MRNRSSGRAAEKRENKKVLFCDRPPWATRVPQNEPTRTGSCRRSFSRCSSDISKTLDSQIIIRLLDCDLVIADLSSLNPNVFYEIGIRHMIQKPIIHMYLEGTKIPFDVAPYRAIRFKLSHPQGP